MIPSGQNLNLYVGDSFSQTLNVLDIDLNNWTGEAGVKYRYGLTGYALIFDYNVENSGSFTITCPAYLTTGLSVGNHPYNIQIKSGDYAQTIYYGYVAVYPNVINN